MNLDVVIIGSGPAGSSAAFLLAQLGWKVGLLEKQRFPREKLCGEFISPEGVSDLSSLGLWPALAMHEPPPVNRTRVTFPSGHNLKIDFESPGRGLSRSILDRVLFEQARRQGADCFERCSARSIEGDLTNGFLVTAAHAEDGPITFTAKTVIAATGRWANLPWRVPRAQGASAATVFLGIKAHFRGDADLQNAVELHFFPGGYCGLNKVEGDEINLCALVEQRRAMQFANDWGGLLGSAAAHNPGLHDRLKTLHRVSSFLVTSPIILGEQKQVTGETLRVGDAAGFLDPFSGDGISTAIRSAVMAARCLDSFLRGKASPVTALRRYQKAFDSEFHRRFVFARMIRRLLPWSPLVPLIASLQSKSPRLGQWLVRQTRGAAHGRSSTG